MTNLDAGNFVLLTAPGLLAWGLLNGLTWLIAPAARPYMNRLFMVFWLAFTVLFMPMGIPTTERADLWLWWAFIMGFPWLWLLWVVGHRLSAPRPAR
jgi:hypothetical protein